MDAAEQKPDLLEALSELKSATYDADGITVDLVELTAGQALEIWEDLAAYERENRLIDVYRLLVFHGAWADGRRLFSGHLLEDVDQLPLRHLVPMGELMLQLCDMGLDVGNAVGDQGNTSPTG